MTPAQAPAQTQAHRPYSASWVTRSVFSNWFGLTANLLIAFFLSPFVVHRLGDAAYGIWALVLQLTGYMGVADVSLRSALVRFVSRLRAQQDNKGLSELMSSTLLLYLACAGICLIGGGLLAILALPHLHIPSHLIADARITLLVATLILATDFAFATFQGCLAGLSRWDLRNLVAVAVLLLRSVLTVAVLLANHGLVALAFVQLFASLLGHVAEVYIVRWQLPDLRLSLRAFKKRLMRPVLSHSFNSFLIALGVGVNYEVDAIVIAVFLPISQVTYYVIGFNLVKYLRTLINASSMIVAPLASHLEAEGDPQGISRLFYTGNKYVLLLAYLGCAALLCLGTDFIHVWMGEDYARHAHAVILLLTLGLFFSFTENIGAHMLFGLSKHRVNVWCTGSEALLNLAASILLVRRFGIYGVAAGTTLAAILVRGWFFPQACLKLLNLRWKEYLRTAFAPTFVPTLAFAAGALMVRYLLPGLNYKALFLAASGGFLFWIPALALFGLNPEERRQLARIVTSRLPAFAPDGKRAVAVAASEGGK